MSCNAWNHPPECNCDFRGGWHGGDRSFESEFDRRLFSRHLRDRSEARQKETWTGLSDGYTNPNARCPECGAAVYFYRSPYGGRVFFDELGPPWPKHWCTDSTRFDEARVTWMTPARRSSSPPWHQDGWRSLTEVYVDRVSEGVCKIRSASLELIFRCAEPPAIFAARVRRRADGSYDLSLLEYDERVDLWVTHEGTARLHYAGLKREDQALLRRPVVAPFRQNEPQDTTEPAKPVDVKQAPDEGSSSSVPQARKQILLVKKTPPSSAP